MLPYCYFSLSEQARFLFMQSFIFHLAKINVLEKKTTDLICFSNISILLQSIFVENIEARNKKKNHQKQYCNEELLNQKSYLELILVKRGSFWYTGEKRPSLIHGRHNCYTNLDQQFSTGAISTSRGHLAMSGDMFGSHNCGIQLASCIQKPEILLIMSQSLPRNYLVQNVNSSKILNTTLDSEQGYKAGYCRENRY